MSNCCTSSSTLTVVCEPFGAAADVELLHLQQHFDSGLHTSWAQPMGAPFLARAAALAVLRPVRRVMRPAACGIDSGPPVSAAARMRPPSMLRFLKNCTCWFLRAFL